jgi:prolyl oligopeptidase
MSRITTVSSWVITALSAQSGVAMRRPGWRRRRYVATARRAGRGRLWLLSLCAALGAAAATAAADQAPVYPPASKRPVAQTFHGVTVVDDYRWMEDDSAPEVKAWVRDQNALTRKVLDAVAQRPEIGRRVGELLRTQTVSRSDFRYRGGVVFAMKFAPPKDQPVLVALPRSLDVSAERVVLDPTVVDPSGRTTIDFYVPSFDGKYVALSLSANGSEVGTAYVIEVATGKRLGDAVPRVMYPTAGGSIEWAADGKGFYYTRYPAAGERPEADQHFYQTIWFHTLGTPITADRYVIGRQFPRIAEIELAGSLDGRDLLAQVKNGDGGDIAYYLRRSGGSWRQVADFTDGIKQMRFGQDGNLYARSAKGTPLGHILAIPVADARLARARVVVPEATLAAGSLAVGHARLYVQYRDGGPSVVRMFDLRGQALGALPAQALSDTAVDAILDGDNAIVRVTSFVRPATRYRYEAARNRLVETPLNGNPPYNFDDATVEREFAVSKDGTRVPVTIVHAKGIKLDGTHPTLLYGYGGYGISMTPRVNPMRRLWLDYGGVYAEAGLRGGGEYGEAWHVAGMLTRKQNVFDDFAASMQLLVDLKVTTPDRLAIMGGSNGGLTMGAALTQQPQAMRAVVSQVGIYDALRWETQPNGEFNVTEFGSTKDPDQFKALYAYSPILRIKDGVKYPAVLFTTGDNDGRVAPYESRKMVARLQAASASGYPILLRTEAAAGHGIGSALSTRIEEATDVYTFLVEQLGITGPVKPQ